MHEIKDHTVESDPYVLDEVRERVRATLEEHKPGTTPEQWCLIARQQLLHWMKWARVYDDIAPYFEAQPKNHRLPLDVVFGAFFVHDDPESERYAEVPLLMALLQGDVEDAKNAAKVLEVPLSPAVLQGPFPPFDKPRGGLRGEE